MNEGAGVGLQSSQRLAPYRSGQHCSISLHSPLSSMQPPQTTRTAPQPRRLYINVILQAATALRYIAVTAARADRLVGYFSHKMCTFIFFSCGKNSTKLGFWSELDYKLAQFLSFLFQILFEFYYHFTSLDSFLVNCVRLIMKFYILMVVTINSTLGRKLVNGYR